MPACRWPRTQVGEGDGPAVAGDGVGDERRGDRGSGGAVLRVRYVLTPRA